MKKSLTLTAMGLFVASASLSVAQTPIYQTGFESSGDPSGVSFSAGNLNGQGGWEVSQGAASVTSSAPGAAEGSQYVNQTTNSIVRRTITGASGDRAVVRGKYYGSGSATLTLPTTANPVAALVGFETVDGSSFSIKAYNGTTDSFVAGSGTFSNTQWHDIDLNIRYATASQPNSFDVNVNGVPYLTAIPFADNTVSSLNGFESHAETSSNTDGLGFFTSDGDFDNDGFSDDEEFADPNLNPFELDQARSLAQAIPNPTIPNDQLNTYSFPAGVSHWLPIDVSGCSNIQITATSKNGGDIQIQLFDARPLTDVTNPTGAIRISESFVGLTESLTYVNNTGATTLFLQVYEEGFDSNLEYDIQVTTIAGDDVFEPNPGFPFVSSLPLGLSQDLILKDDDVFRIDTTGISNLAVTVNHDFNFGQIYFQVLEDQAGFSPLGDSFVPNQNSHGTVVDVTGRTSVLVRVYSASLVATNFYDLEVTNAGSEPSINEVEYADFEALPDRYLPEYVVAQTTPATKGVDDIYEENDVLEQLAGSMTPLPTDVVNTGLVLEDEDWYYLDLSSGDSVRVNVNFVDSQGDLGMEIYEARCFFDGNGARIKVAQSYNIDQDFEFAPYVNNTGNNRIYVRVFAQTPGDTNTYSILAERFTDDALELGGTPGDASNGLALNTTVENLVLRDDDFYRINTAGVNTLNVTLQHDFNLGQLYVQLLNDDGGYNVLNGDPNAQNFAANNSTLTLSNVDVSTNDSVVLRVFAANRGANIYNLTVNTTP